MIMVHFDRRYIFCNTFKVRNSLHAASREDKFHVAKDKPKWIRKVVRFANSTNKVLIKQAMNIATVVVGAFDLLRSPYSIYKYKQRIKQSNQEAIQLLCRKEEPKTPTTDPGKDPVDTTPKNPD